MTTPLIHHMWAIAVVSRNISIIIIRRHKDDQWLIYGAHIETDFTKCFSIQDQKKRALTRGNNDLTVNKKNDKMYHS